MIQYNQNFCYGHDGRPVQYMSPDLHAEFQRAQEQGDYQVRNLNESGPKTDSKPYLVYTAPEPK